MSWNLKDDILNAVRANGSKNCPNCGAVIESEKCPFCGTLFIDFACVDVDQPFFMKIKQKDKIFIIKCRLTSASMHTEPVYAYAGDICLQAVRGPTELTMEFVCC